MHRKLAMNFMFLERFLSEEVGNDESMVVGRNTYVAGDEVEVTLASLAFSESEGWC